MWTSREKPATMREVAPPLSYVHEAKRAYPTAAFAHHHRWHRPRAAPRLHARHGARRRGHRAALHRRRHHRRRYDALQRHARRTGGARAGRRARRRRHAARVHDHFRLRRHQHEPPGHEMLAGVARGDRRFDRAGDARPCLRRPDRLRRLRQESARHHDGHGPLQCAVGLHLRRRDADRHAPRQAGLGADRL